MDVRGEALLVGDALEQIVEAAPLVVRQSGKERALVFAGDLADGGKHPAALRREVEGVAATVVLIAAALDQAAAVQHIEQGDKAAGDHLEARG